MRQTLSIPILLLTLSLPGWLAFAFLQFQKHQVRQVIKENLLAGVDPSLLVELKFAKAEVKDLLKWEHGREFEYQGQMYDVVEILTEGDSLRYRCFQDHEETELNRRLDRLVAGALGHDPCRQATTEHLASFFQSLYCVENAVLTFLTSELARVSHPYAATAGRACLPPPVPPPEGEGVFSVLGSRFSVLGSRFSAGLFECRGQA